MVVYVPQKQKSKPAKVKKTKATRENGGFDVYDVNIRQHINMIVDPCGSPLTRSAYSGQSGVLTRHTIQLNQNLGANAASAFVVSPGGFRNFAVSALTDTTSFLPAYGNSFVPGITYLTGIASQVRCVAACMRVHWSGTELNRAGSVAYGTVSGGQIPTANTTVSEIFTMLAKKTRTPDGVFEVKWNPSEEDEGYAPTALATPSYDFNDRTMMAFAYTGPTAATFAISITCIYEWLPLLTAGQPAPPTVRSSTPAAVPRINNILNKMKRGAESFNTMAVDAATTMSSMYAAGSSGYRLLTGAKAMGTAALAIL